MQHNINNFRNSSTILCCFLPFIFLDFGMPSAQYSNGCYVCKSTRLITAHPSLFLVWNCERNTTIHSVESVTCTLKTIKAGFQYCSLRISFGSYAGGGCRHYHASRTRRDRLIKKVPLIQISTYISSNMICTGN